MASKHSNIADFAEAAGLEMPGLIWHETALEDAETTSAYVRAHAGHQLFCTVSEKFKHPSQPGWVQSYSIFCVECSAKLNAAVEAAGGLAESRV